MARIELELPVPPGTNEWKITLKSGRVILGETFRIWREAALELARMRCPRMLTGPLFVRVRTFRPRKAGDWDAPIKLLCDSLQGVVYEDDDQVCGGEVFRFTDPSHPRVLVEVIEVEDQPMPRVPCSLSPQERQVFNRCLVALELARAKKQERRKAKEQATQGRQAQESLVDFARRVAKPSVRKP